MTRRLREFVNDDGWIEGFVVDWASLRNVVVLGEVFRARHLYIHQGENNNFSSPLRNNLFNLASGRQNDQQQQHARHAPDGGYRHFFERNVFASHIIKI